LGEPGTSFSQRLQSALVDALLAGIIAFALFSLLLGLRTVDSVIGLTLEPRPQLLAVAVGIVMVGRLLLNLFVWQAEYPITLPFARLFTRETFERRDILVLGITALVSAIVFVVGSIVGNAASQLVAGGVLAFLGVGFLRRTIVFFFPELPYARIFTVGGIAFAVLFPICSYFLEKAFHLGLPLRYLLDLSILVLTYIMPSAPRLSRCSPRISAWASGYACRSQVLPPRCGASFSASRCSGFAATISPL